ncbi:hypothetical protein JTB14_000406 [Gonioctena quinquepunctata]|nr:hypothetical protein JTB14_000406 [Gonioctena quinquepunctata]
MTKTLANGTIDTDIVGQQSKRKRKEDTPVKCREASNKNARTLKRNLDMILKQIIILYTVVKGAFKPKVEYTDSKAVDMLAQQIHREGLIEWLEEIETDMREHSQQQKNCFL